MKQTIKQLYIFVYLYIYIQYIYTQHISLSDGYLVEIRSRWIMSPELCDTFLCWKWIAVLWYCFTAVIWMSNYESLSMDPSKIHSRNHIKGRHTVIQIYYLYWWICLCVERIRTDKREEVSFSINIWEKTNRPFWHRAQFPINHSAALISCGIQNVFKSLL